MFFDGAGAQTGNGAGVVFASPTLHAEKQLLSQLDSDLFVQRTLQNMKHCLKGWK